MKNFPIWFDQLANKRHWDVSGMPREPFWAGEELPDSVVACGRPSRGMSRGTINEEQPGRLSLNCERCQVELVAWRLRSEAAVDKAYEENDLFIGKDGRYIPFSDRQKPGQ